MTRRDGAAAGGGAAAGCKKKFADAKTARRKVMAHLLLLRILPHIRTLIAAIRTDLGEADASHC